ncbi:hypothetical protein J2T57_001213 [Natronocella acetinitrilica]|uniref:Uncharacterized protein n=1 Tax=Natronocella acetinitrilica TaxID=414046 RepID=A0AAE3G3M1_9GAMM|nr:hypothetical protein [Natronocella acetinitrilica]MCP1674111.1 hypothetical protein [Natronocella acetinitrilica]
MGDRRKVDLKSRVRQFRGLSVSTSNGWVSVVAAVTARDGVQQHDRGAFAVATYGEEEALRLALQFRNDAFRYHGLPQRFLIPEPFSLPARCHTARSGFTTIALECTTLPSGSVRYNAVTEVPRLSDAGVIQISRSTTQAARATAAIHAAVVQRALFSNAFNACLEAFTPEAQAHVHSLAEREAEDLRPRLYTPRLLPLWQRQAQAYLAQCEDAEYEALTALEHRKPLRQPFREHERRGQGTTRVKRPWHVV